VLALNWTLGRLVFGKRGFLPCTRYFPKSRLNATLQMVINGTNPGLWSVFDIEALWGATSWQAILRLEIIIIYLRLFFSSTEKLLAK
jgi:hypothetical protein